MSEPVNNTPTTTFEKKPDDIRAAMSVSNMLTPPSLAVDVSGPSTPPATSPPAHLAAANIHQASNNLNEDTAVPGATEVAMNTEDIMDTKENTMDTKENTMNTKEDTMDTKEDTMDTKEDTMDTKEDTMDRQEVTANVAMVTDGDTEIPPTPPSVGGRPDQNIKLDSSPAAGDADDNEVREFECRNDDYSRCSSGQYTLGLSRKVISDHFGRNKACTRVIQDWPLFCRKHYQRATYNSAQWQLRKVHLIIRQFDIIEQQYPGTKYTVALKKSEDDRLNLYSRKISSGMKPEDAAKVVAPKANKHFEAEVNTLRELEDHLGKDKSMDNCKQTMANICEMLQLGESTQVPSIEFLPQLDENGHTWTAAEGGSPHKDKSPKKKAKPTHVSKKGGVKKPAAEKKTKLNV